MDALFLVLVVILPGVLGLVALGLGIHFLRSPADAELRSTARTVFGVLALLVALGVGGCYAFVFLGAGHH